MDVDVEERKCVPATDSVAAAIDSLNMHEAVLFGDGNDPQDAITASGKSLFYCFIIGSDGLRLATTFSSHPSARLHKKPEYFWSSSSPPFVSPSSSSSCTGICVLRLIFRRFSRLVPEMGTNTGPEVLRCQSRECVVADVVVSSSDR